MFLLMLGVLPWTCLSMKLYDCSDPRILELKVLLHSAEAAHFTRHLGRRDGRPVHSARCGASHEERSFVESRQMRRRWLAWAREVLEAW